jgi:hypothetical protein
MLATEPKVAMVAPRARSRAARNGIQGVLAFRGAGDRGVTLEVEAVGRPAVLAAAALCHATRVPRTFTHGTSAQRVRWSRKGFETGQTQACDTFGAPPL